MYKILLLTDLYQHSIQHDRFFETPYLDKDIIKNKLNCEIYLWGPGIDNEKIDWSDPIQDRIEQIYGDKFFFDIIIQLPGGGVLDTSFYSYPESKTLIFIHFLEVPNNNDIDIIDRLKPHIIFYISNENALQLFYSKKYQNKIIGSFPMYHSESLAKQKFSNKKEIDLLIVGNLNSKLYPFRKKIVGLIKNSEKLTKYNIYIKPTVSYSEQNINNIISTYPQTLNESKEQVNYYLDLINKSKLVLCTSHSKIPNYGIYYTTFRLRKYAEIGMSTALRIGDISDEDYYNLEKINYVDMSNKTNDEIIDTIIYYIENNKEREELVKLQNEFEFNNYTASHFIEKILYCNKMFQLKKFGYYNFHCFRMLY